MATEILVKDLRQAFEQARELDGSMAERLDVFADATRKLHPSTSAIVDRLVTRLKQNDAGKDAPKPGDVMPPFMLPDETGRLVELERSPDAGPRRGHVSPGALVSVLPHQHQYSCKSATTHRGARRPHGGHRA